MQSNSSTSAASGKPDKPTRDFPLYAHATKRWAKKIGGKLIYFGPWDDPQGALSRYHAYAVGEVSTGRQERASDGRQERASDDNDKPSKPYPEFPLYAHATGRWAKKIRGELHYFGAWNDPDGALAKYLEQRDDLHAGRTPRPDASGLTVKDLANAFLNFKTAALETAELSIHTWNNYKQTCDLLVSTFGKQRLVADIRQDDFATMKKDMAKKWGLQRIDKGIQFVRCVFKYGYDAELIAAPVRFGPGFARPSKKAHRLERARKGPKLFTRDELRAMLDDSKGQLRAMILLAVNCGFGNSDCASLPASAINLETAWLDFPRPKTGIPRRCPLWPETVEAIKAALADRPQPKNPEHASLIFITKYGGSWGKGTSDNPISKEIRKLLDALNIKRAGAGFYTLRHVFRTVADETRDQPAVNFIMGHCPGDMASVYRETIADERLKAVADHVRSWLFGKEAGHVE